MFRNAKKTSYDFYKTPEFWAYVDTYAAFVKEYAHAIDYYATVDVLFNPEMSWEVLKYMEGEHGLNPVPVIHYNTPIKWIEKHLEEGYDYLGIGGLGQEISKSSYYGWADKVYSVICDPKTKLPTVRTHGFAMTAYDLLIRYPWWSVDSASWAKAGGFGRLYVPRTQSGKWSFAKPPYNISVSGKAPSKHEQGKNLLTMTQGEQKAVRNWLDHIEVPFGSVDKDGNEVEYGVVSHHAARKIANLRFFMALVEWLPDWPWPFTGLQRRGFR